MTTIVYKNLLNRYLIDSCFEADGDGISVELSEPIDARLAIGTEIYKVKTGLCRIRSLSEGEILPRLYTSTCVYELEGFVYRNGKATPSRDRSGMIAELCRAVDSITERLTAAEKEIIDLNERVSRRISILGYLDTENNKMKGTL